MGQKKKARQAAQSLGFELTTFYNPKEIQEVLVATANALTPGGLKFGFAQTGVNVDSTQLVSKWVLKDRIRSNALNFQVVVTSSHSVNDDFVAKMEIGDFKYAQGQFFFMKPRIVGESEMKKFSQIVLSELSTPTT